MMTLLLPRPSAPIAHLESSRRRRHSCVLFCFLSFPWFICLVPFIVFVGQKGTCSIFLCTNTKASTLHGSGVEFSLRVRHSTGNRRGTGGDPCDCPHSLTSSAKEERYRGRSLRRTGDFFRERIPPRRATPRA
jgi:hypothetical protein